MLVTLLGRARRPPTRRARFYAGAARGVRDRSSARRPGREHYEVAYRRHAAVTRGVAVNELFGIPLDTLARHPRGRARDRARRPRRARRAQPRPRQARGPQRRRAGAAARRSSSLGLMLGTAIIAAALVTGDTMSHTIRASAIAALGQTDEVVAAKSAGTISPATSATRPASAASPSASPADPRRRRPGPRDGVVAGRHRARRGAGARGRGRTSRRVDALRAPTLPGWPASRRSSARRGHVALAELRPGELYLNQTAADELDAQPGRPVLAFSPAAGAACACATSSSSTAPRTGTPRCCSRSRQAQRCFARPGQVKTPDLEPRRPAPGRAHTDEVASSSSRPLDPLGLELTASSRTGSRRPTSRATRSCRSSRRSARSRSWPASC